MAVKPHPKDAAGNELDSRVTSLAATTVPASSPSKPTVDATLLETRKQLVNHYMNIGRIDPATVLSTLS